MIYAQTLRVERRASLGLAALMVFLVGTPPLLNWGQGFSFLTALGPLATWGVNLWLFGWPRMVTATALIFTSNGDLDTQAGAAFLAGRALLDTIHDPSHRAPTAHLEPDRLLGRPFVKGHISREGQPDQPLTPQECDALAPILTRGRSLYALAFFRPTTLPLPIPDTRHAQIAAIHHAGEALGQAHGLAELIAKATAPARLLGRLFPGKVPL